jgi:hypothetical protein
VGGLWSGLEVHGAEGVVGNLIDMHRRFGMRVRKIGGTAGVVGLVLTDVSMAANSDLGLIVSRVI